MTPLPTSCSSRRTASSPSPSRRPRAGRRDRGRRPRGPGRRRDGRLEPYSDDVAAGPLVPTPPAPGPVVETEDLGEGVTRWTLANGVRVLLKPTDFQNDEADRGDEPGRDVAPRPRHLPGPPSSPRRRGRVERGGRVLADGAPRKSWPARPSPSARSSPSGPRASGARPRPTTSRRRSQLVYLQMTAPRRDEDSLCLVARPSSGRSSATCPPTRRTCSRTRSRSRSRTTTRAASRSR